MPEFQEAFNKILNNGSRQIFLVYHRLERMRREDSDNLDEQDMWIAFCAWEYLISRTLPEKRTLALSLRGGLRTNYVERFLRLDCTE